MFSPDGNDHGSLEEFKDLVIREMKRRVEYDQCMFKRFWQYWPSSLVYRRVDVDSHKPYSHDICHGNSVKNTELNVEFVYREDHLQKNLLWDRSQSSIKSDMESKIRANTEKRRAQHAEAVFTCFGSEFLRSPQLGLRHVDKGIYFDQLYRSSYLSQYKFCTILLLVVYILIFIIALF